MAKKDFATESTYRKLKFDEVYDFLDKYGTKEEKAEFRKACYSNKDGEETDKFSWLSGKIWFCKKFAPWLVPATKKSDLIKDWV